MVKQSVFNIEHGVVEKDKANYGVNIVYVMFSKGTQNKSSGKESTYFEKQDYL